MPDLEREKRMARQIEDAILDGEPVALQTREGLSFLAIRMQSADALPKGTVIILHGRGLHPDWDTVVRPLRVGLTENGWNTLSIQLPVLAKNAKYFDYLKIFDAANPRIEAAITSARTNWPGPVVLLAHSCGSHMAQHWMHSRAKRTSELPDAFIGIGMGATDYGQPMREPFSLDQMQFPLLDIYAENDFPAVLRMAPQRLRALDRGGNAKNAQLMVADSDHYFVDRGDALVQAVAAWLDML